MKFYSKLIRINGESVLAVEQGNRTVKVWPITKANLKRCWK